MASPKLIRAPGTGRNGGRRPPRKYRIAEFVRAYVLALAGCLAALLVDPVAGVLAWPICGLLVSRFVSKRVIWWSQTNNLANVAGSKLSMVLRWPLTMPALIFRLIVVRYL